MKELKGTIVITTGGTGGHMFPAAGFARELVRNGYAISVITDSRGSRFKDAFSSKFFYVISASSPRGGILKLLTGVTSLCVGFFQSFIIIRRQKTKAIVSFGGYAATPAVFAGFLLRVPVIMHEQNAVLGKANRSFARFAKAIALSFRNTKYAPTKKRTEFTGIPIREEILPFARSVYPELSASSPFNILILGGSQGSALLSRVIPQALISLPKELRIRLNIVEQCRKEDVEEVRKMYSDSGLKAEVSDFFGDVEKRIQFSHLVIGRAGASTIAEVNLIGRPMVLIPLGIAKDGDQLCNASVVRDSGAGWIMEEGEFSAENLNKIIIYLMENPVFLKEVAHNSAEMGIPDAHERLLRLVLEYCKQ